MSQILNLEPLLMASAGSKKIIIRRGVHSYTPGPCLVANIENDAETFSVEITRMYVSTFENIPLEDIKSNGALCHDDLLEELRQFYPDMTANTGCTVICWK